MEHGVFIISDGQRSFLATAFDGKRLRFDPGCMSPCDQRARETVAFFADALNGAEQHIWSDSDSVLLIDNRRALHARPAAHLEPERALDRLTFHLLERASA
jgi:hypothetical protein